MPAGGKKERNAARHVRVDLCVQRLEVYLEQRPKQHGHSDEIKEEPRRRCEALRGEGRQRAEFARLSQLTQQSDPKFSAEITRLPADFGGQIGEPVRFRDRQPH